MLDNAGERNVGNQCVSSVLPIIFQCVPIMQIPTGFTLGHHLVLASPSVVPLIFRCTSGSSGLPVCSKYANELWIATGWPLGDSINQCVSSVVRPLVSQRTDSLWFGGQHVRPLPSMQPLMFTTVMARKFSTATKNTKKNYNGAHIKSIHWVMLKYSHVWRAKLVVQSSKLRKNNWIYRDLSTCCLVSRHLGISNWHGCYSV